MSIRGLRLGAQGSRLAAAAVVLAALTLVSAADDAPKTFLIAGARVADGTGGPIEKKDVRIAGDKIAEVGKLEPKAGETVVRADRFVLAPGFIDPHNHSTEGLETDPLAETQVSRASRPSSSVPTAIPRGRSASTSPRARRSPPRST